MSAYASKPLPPLPQEVIVKSQASAAAQEKQQSVQAQFAQRKRSKLDGAVRSMKLVVGQCKSKYHRQTKKVRLSLAWEVEEIV